MSSTTVQELIRAVVAARSSSYADHRAIIALCTIAGEPDLAPEFLKEGLPVADVRSRLLDKKAEESDATLIWPYYFEPPNKSD